MKDNLKYSINYVMLDSKTIFIDGEELFSSNFSFFSANKHPLLPVELSPKSDQETTEHSGNKKRIYEKKLYALS